MQRRSFSEACEIMGIDAEECSRMQGFENLSDLDFHSAFAQIMAVNICALDVSFESDAPEEQCVHLSDKLSTLARLYAGMSGQDVAIRATAADTLDRLEFESNNVESN